MEQAAERNLKLYLFVKIFSKRVFLPVTAIYAVTVSGLAIEEIGLIAAIGFLGRLILEVPSGYFADRFGKSTSLVVGGVFNVAGMACIAFIQNKYGILIGITLDAIGHAFYSGSGEALMHDSLEVLDRGDDYSKVLSRIQAKSLIVNAALIGLVPLTYAIDERLPFIVAIFANLGMVILGVLMTDVAVKAKSAMSSVKKFKLRDIRNHSSFIWFALLFGLMAAFYSAPADLRNLALIEYGFRPELLGIVFSISSLTGAVVGFQIHRLKLLSIKNFVLTDGFMLLFCLSVFTTGSMWLAALGLMVLRSFWRYRYILYGDYLLNKYPTKYKATLLSVMRNVDGLQGTWLAILLAYIVAQLGNQDGFALITVLAAVVLVPFTISAVKTLEPSKSN